jgi:hypothetical protein
VKKFLDITCLILIALFWSRSHAQSCHGGGGGGTPTGGSGAGGPFSGEGIGAAGTCNGFDDSTKMIANFYGLVNGSFAFDGHKGDPLGTGGKIPLSYNTELYQEQAFDLPSLYKRDLRVQYGDFGYIPVWASNIFYAHVQYRLSEELLAAVGVSYGGDPGQPGSNTTTGSWNIAEMSLGWYPKNLTGFALKAGNILDVGSYSTLFGVAPMQNFYYTGLLLSYDKIFSHINSAGLSIGAGGILQNVTIFAEPSNTNFYPKYENGNNGYIASVRNRTYLYADAHANFMSNFSLKGLVGIQTVPKDSTGEYSTLNPTLNKRFSKEYRRTQGWQTGLEGGYYGKYTNQTVSINYGFGDVIAGWGTTDFVRYSSVIDTNPYALVKRDTFFSKIDSRALNLIYWGDVAIKRFRLGTGVWYMLRTPASNIIMEDNANLNWSGLVSDSLLALAGYTRDSLVTLETQPFKTVKFAILSSMGVVGPFRIGMRYDYIKYLTPNSHTNMQEPLRDEALRPVPFVVTDVHPSGPAKWEREAVNANIYSPMFMLEFPDLGGINFIYSYGAYNKEINRQGQIGKVQQNFTVSAYVNYQIRKKT